jgi:hypothetical protein
MAQAGNPGTPPAAGAPDAQGGTTPVGSDGGQAKRLIAGKYETIEDAVEQGIFGMEQAFHKTREDLAKVTRVLEHVVSGGNQPPMDNRGGYAPVGTGGRGGNDYGRAPNNDPDYVDPAAFIVNPGQVLQARDARILRQVAGVVENVVTNAMVVSEFKRQNPDLVPHERIVRAFMNETDPSKGYSERLSDAAQMTKRYLAEVRGNQGNNNPPPAGGNFVESPRGAGGPGGQVPLGSTVPPGSQDEEEKELMEYISERNKDLSARFGIKT